MFSIVDDFRSSDVNKQPYSFSIERHTPIDNMHAWVDNDSFHMASIGNRYILNSPVFLNGEFNMSFKISYMSTIRPKFFIFFGYDEVSRCGYGISFAYDLANTITLCLVEVYNKYTSTLQQNNVELAAPLVDGEEYLCNLKLDGGCASGNVAGADFSFSFQPRKGKLALERENFIGELIIDNISFVSSDDFNFENILEETTVDIPLVNGGDIPYKVTWRVDKVDDDYFLIAKLDGGTRTRKVNREDRPGQYVAEKDWMTSPYIGLGSKNKLSTNFCFARGEKAFIDPNIFWDCQKSFFGDTELPLVSTIKIPKSLLCEDLEIVFGYENLICTGYLTQPGSSEFRFTPNGELIYSGDIADGRDIFELYSQENKLALSFVPEDCYERNLVVEHIKYNHYFDVSEDIDFTFVMRTMVNVDYLEVNAVVMNIYETEEVGHYSTNLEVGTWNYGYNQITAKVHVPKMKLGLWKIVFNISFGGKFYKSYRKVFEVFDQNSDINPAIASGLPFVFHMPNEHKWLMRNAFDLWTPMKSCDLVHYYNCITDTPVEAMVRKPWMLIKKFKRDWFAWISSRTCKDWNIENYSDVVKNCDYLFYSCKEKIVDLGQSSLYPIRQDHFSYSNFMRRESERIPILDEFLALNPDIAEKLTYAPGMKFTEAHFVELMRLCRNEWIRFQNEKGLALLKEQNGELEKINPNVKRSVYGPINVYVTPTLTNHSLGVYCNDDYNAITKDIFTGFAIFEDYPFSCSYQTYRGAFTLMTLLLHCPGLTIYPEQYSGGRGGCIDGAVKFAHAPMGKYDLPSYQNATHAFEFVFNTAHKLADGYHYWDTYGFHRAPSLIEDLSVAWKYVIQNKPRQPMKSMAILAEYSDKEDYFEIYKHNNGKQTYGIVNPSEMGHGVIYETARESGVPNPFALKYDALSSLTGEECDILVLPCLKEVDSSIIREIRRLYNEGVNLMATSDVSGLEDIFGVAKDERMVNINCISAGDDKEFVRECEAKLNYRPSVGTPVLSDGNGNPLIIKTSRTLLINTSVTNLGSSDSIHMVVGRAPHIIGHLLRQSLIAAIRSLSAPLALGENVGVTLFQTHDNRNMLLAIDYTPFDNVERKPKEAVIKLNIETCKEVKCDRQIFVGKKDGIVKELRFSIKEHESVFVELLP